MASKYDAEITRLQDALREIYYSIPELKIRLRGCYLHSKRLRPFREPRVKEKYDEFLTRWWAIWHSAKDALSELPLPVRNELEKFQDIWCARLRLKLQEFPYYVPADTSLSELGRLRNGVPEIDENMFHQFDKELTVIRERNVEGDDSDSTQWSELTTKAEIARLFGVCRDTVYDWIKTGELKIDDSPKGYRVRYDLNSPVCRKK